MIGLDSDMVLIYKHNKKWKIFYENEEVLLKGNLKKIDSVVEHIGSTAIENLDAKPIIDIMIGYYQNEDLNLIVESLEKIDYINKGEAGIPERIFLVKKVKDKTTHHIHLTKMDSQFWFDTFL